MSSQDMIMRRFCLFIDLVLLRLQNLGTIVMTFYSYSKNIWGWCHHLNLKSMLLNPWGRWDFSGSHNTFFLFVLWHNWCLPCLNYPPLPPYSWKWPKNCSWNLPAEMTQPEVDTWPGKLLPKQKSDCKQMKIVLSWEVLANKERGYITHSVSNFCISIEKKPPH